MNVDDEFLRNFVRTLDALLNMTRDKLVFQNLAISMIGPEWEQEYEKFRSDPRVQREIDVLMADAVASRVKALQMLESLRRGDPLPSKDEPIQ